MGTLRVIRFVVLASGILAGSTYAQNASKPLNLALPTNSGLPSSNPAPAGTPSASATQFSTTPASASTAPAGTTTPANADTTPGVYYGDHSGATVAGDADNPDDATESCDDATVNKPQVHGSVSTGVAAGNHFSGNYQAATVNVTKPLGDCKHPKGSVSITVHVSQDHFGYHGSH